MHRLKRKYLPWLFAIIMGGLGTFQYHLAQFTSRFDTFFGDRGDARGVVALCEHWYQALTGRAELLSPAMFYPVKGTLGYSEFLLGLGIPYSVLRSIGLDMFSSLQSVVIVLTFLNYLACFVLLYKTLRFHPLASSAGAMFFAFNSPKFVQMIHLQLQYVLLLPLIVILVVSFAQKSDKPGQKRAMALLSLAAVLLNLQLLTAFYFAWFLVFWGFLFLVLALVFSNSRLCMFALAKRHWPSLVVSTFVFLLGFIPFLFIYLPTIRIGSWYPYDYVTEMIPEWWSLLAMGNGNYVWGWLCPAVRPKPLPPTWGELNNGIGLIPSLTWILISFWTIWFLYMTSRSKSGKDAGANARIQKAAPVFLAVTILATSVFYLLGFKYWNNQSPWFFVYSYYPGAKAIRAVARYVIFLSLPMAIGFAYVLNAGLQSIAKQKTRAVRMILVFGIALVAAFGVFEQFGVFTYGGTGFSKRAEKEYLNAMAAKLSSDCNAFYLAAGRHANHSVAEYQYDAMLLSVLRGIPTLNGSSSQFPPDWNLYQVKDSDYEANVKKWIDSQKITGKVCRLEIGPQFDAFDPNLPSPLDEPAFFVRQHYHDFLDRGPTSEELDRWVAKLHNCKVNYVSCDRAEISLDLFNATGFYDKGAFISRLYEVGLGRIPRYEEFVSEMTRVNSEPLETAKDRLAREFVERPEFTARYKGLSDNQFLMKLLKTAQVELSNDLLLAPSGGQDKQVEILRKILDSDEVSRRLSNRAFVALHYFGYLRRDPEAAGFDWWVQSLNTTGNFRLVTAGFINSSEYRQRFLTNP